MWFEYIAMSDKDRLSIFGDEYENQLGLYTEQAIGSRAKAFTKRKGGNIFQHRHFNTFKNLKGFADKYMIKYDDFWAIAFDLVRSNGSIKLRGVTTFKAQYILDDVLLREQEMYKNRLKLATSAIFNTDYYDPQNDVFLLYEQFVYNQIISKYPQNYLIVIKDLAESKKFSLDFLKEYHTIEYENLIKRFGGRVHAN